MKYDTLKALVNAKVYENTEQEITGGDMNDVLQSAISSLGAHYQMGGLVSPTDHIAVGDEPVVFIATTPGTYTYFGSQVVADGEVALLVWSGTAWSKQTTDISTRTELSQLGQKVDDATTHNRNQADAITIMDNAEITSGGGIGYSAAGAKVICFPCKKETTYTISKIVTTRFRVMLTSVAPRYTVVGTNVIDNHSASAITITTSNDTLYIVAYIYDPGQQETTSWADVLASLQIEESAQATPYVKPGYTAIDTTARTEIGEREKVTKNLNKRLSVLHNGLPMMDKINSNFVSITNGGRTLTPEVLSNALLGAYFIGTPTPGCKYVIHYLNYAKGGNLPYSCAIIIARDNGDNTLTSLANYYVGSSAPKGVVRYEINLSNDTGATKAIVQIDWDALSVIDSGESTTSIFQLYATDNSKYVFDQKYLFGENNDLATAQDVEDIKQDVEDIKQDVEDIKSEISNDISINIPNVVYAIPGTELNLWNDAIALSADRGLQSPLNYQVRWWCTKGFITERCFRFTPTDADAGNEYACICYVYNNNFRLLKEKTFIIKVVAKNAISSLKNIAFFGDSLGASSASELYSKFHNTDRYSGTIPNMVGTRGDVVKYDAFGGARLADFATSGTFAYRISVAGIGSVSLGAKYSIPIGGSNVTLTIREVNIIDGAGNLLLEADYGAKVTNFPESGTLTLVSGSGDNQISFTGGFEESGNPLWNDQTNQLDVAQYKSLCGLQPNDKIDAVVFQLGVNGVFDEDLYTQYISNLYDAFVADNPTCKFILALSTYGGNTVNGYGVNYGTGSGGPYEFKQKLEAVNKLYIALATSGNYPNMRIATPGLEVDRYYGYGFSSRPISQEYPTEELYHNNFIHPAPSGYSQIGDSLLAAYTAALAE